MKFVFCLLAALCIFASSSFCFADEPIAILEENIARAIHVLNDPQFEVDTQKAAQYLALVEVFQQLFDYEEFSKQVLGANWKKFNLEERKRFVELLTQFLCHLYLVKLQDLYTDETVAYLSQEKISDSKAKIATTVRWNERDVPIDVWMVKRQGHWRIYNTKALGISFLRFYQSQFKSLLEKNSPNQVIHQMEEKVEALKRRH